MATTHDLVCRRHRLFRPCCRRASGDESAARRRLKPSVMWFCLLLVVPAHRTTGNEVTAPDTHPLMPGIRSRELHNVNWPRTYHDKLVTGFSPLVCGMSAEPELWSSIDVTTTVDWVHAVKDSSGHHQLLVYDGSLRLVSAEGKVLWTNDEVAVARSASQAVLYYGDLRENGQMELLVADSRRLSLVDAVSGKQQWTYLFEPAYVSLQTRPTSLVAADIRPDLPGLEAAVFPMYSERGYLISFPPQGDPKILWDTLAVVPGEHAPGPGGGERADHGCWTQVDLSAGEAPIIWNVRHHRCRGFDPLTGKMVSTLVYEIGGTEKRNYGPATLGYGAAGQRLMCMAGEAVQFHVHTIELNREGPSRLLWQEYYGELLVSGKPGRRALRSVVTGDIDFDGTTEIVYNLTDDSRDLRSFVIVRDAETGYIESELADCQCEHAIVVRDSPSATWLLVRPTAGHTIPASDLLLYRVTGEHPPQQVAHWPEASLWGPQEFSTGQGRGLYLRKTDEHGRLHVARVALEATGPRVVGQSDAPTIVNFSHLATIDQGDGESVYVSAPVEGELRAFSFDGEIRWTLAVAGAIPGSISAADLDGDGRAELLATTPTDQQLHVYNFDDQGNAQEVRSHPHWFSDPRMATNPLAPLVYDLLGDGTLCSICPGQDSTGHSVVRAFRSDGKLLWESVLDREQPAGPPTRWHAGDFLPGPRAGVVVSSRARQGETIQGTFLLDGKSGEIVWQKGGYLTAHNISLPYYPMGVPTAFDLDGDGVEEIGMDFYCYMAWMRGADGEFSMLHHTANLGEAGALYAGRFHNSYIPVFPTKMEATNADGAPHWLVPVGLHGAVGLMNPDPTDGVWREDLGYDMPRKIGMIDVDGDGRLEVGYAPHSKAIFTCRDLASGRIEWQLKLPEAPESPVITADFDGDGRGEFFIGRYCLGVDAEGQGEIRWTLPEKIRSPVIADFNGDGLGELAGFGQRGIRVFQGQGSSK